MTHLFRTLTAGVMFAIGFAAASAVYAQQGQVPSTLTPPMMPSMQQGDMMKMMPQMSEMRGGCIQMMKSHMQQPAGPSPKQDDEQKG